MPAEITLEVPTIVDHKLTGSYGAVITTYRGHEYRVEFGTRYTRAYRDGAACASPPKQVKASQSARNRRIHKLPQASL